MDLRADLLADLQSAASARTLPADPAPAPTETAAVLPTPVLGLQVTPLRWSLPGLKADGLGLRLRVGPLQVSVGLG